MLASILPAFWRLGAIKKQLKMYHNLQPAETLNLQMVWHFPLFSARPYGTWFNTFSRILSNRAASRYGASRFYPLAASRHGTKLCSITQHHATVEMRNQSRITAHETGATCHGNVPFSALCQKHRKALRRTSGSLRRPPPRARWSTRSACR